MAESDTKEEKRVVLVTGGTGFIAGHVIEDLLRNKLNVRATVRGDLKDKRLDYLREMAKKYGSEDMIEFVNADISKDSAFDDIVKGCWAVVHVASPVVLTDSNLTDHTDAPHNKHIPDNQLHS